LQQYFIGAYFNKIHAAGQPILNVAILRKDMPASTLAITDLNLQVSPFVGPGGARIVSPTSDQASLGTLAYLCETNNEIMPPAVPFTWNWVEPGQRRDFDGIVSIKRGTFVQFVRGQLANYVSKNCYKPYITLTQDGLTTIWQWSLPPGQKPAVSVPESGSTVLKFSHSLDSSDKAGLDGAIGECTLRSSFNLDVELEHNKIIIRQNLTIWIKARSLSTERQGNLANKTIVDTITVSVDAGGRLVVGAPETTQTDHPDDVHVDGFLELFTGLNGVTDEIKKSVNAMVSQSLTSVPIGLAQDFIFPGGRTFAFKDVAFSDHQDLVGHITYTTDQ
jgi:hypothetical protein